MGRTLAIGLAAAALLVVIAVATRPSAFRVERSITIAAPPAAPFARVNDFHEWSTWSPYEKKDPQMKRTFDGPRAGTGAIYAWAGNAEVGEGRMTILRSEAPSLVEIRLEFFAPFAATNTATFAFDPAPGGTKVTWAMDGRNGFLGKAISLVLDMDAMIGGDFEQGLVALKTLAEATATARAGAAQAGD
jgi:hypothetical protein